MALDDAMDGSLTVKSLGPLEENVAKVKSAMVDNKRFKNLGFQLSDDRPAGGIGGRSFLIRFRYDPDEKITP
ncbi:MAG TPA: hypothetical protein VFE47_04740 [Tepidisphaeraceae bacterium]|nr:hypothetical protein [Tepidisphaeraceae bacterium]